MRISIRLAIYAALLITIAIIACCTVLLMTTANNQINSAVSSGITELRMLENAFNAEMDVVGDDAMSETAQRSLVLYIFRKYTDTSVSGSFYVLTDAQDILFNDSPIDPRPLLNDLDENELQAYSEDSYEIAELNGRRFLVAGHHDVGLGDALYFEHDVYLVRDITDVYDGIAALSIKFAVIALITVVVGAAVMVILIRRVMRPLGGLQKNAAALANGQYDNRIVVRGRDEIAQLGISFNKMADAISKHIDVLEKTADERKLLLSALTHELKTPMTAIIGYSEALMRVHLSKDQQDQSVMYIHSECKRMERLSQKMMRLIALHGGEPADIKPTPARGLFAEVDMTLRRQADAAGIGLSFAETGSPVFEMDSDMMASVLINLFDNARKAGAKNITMSAEQNKISVKDDGAGIPPDEIEKITQPFYMVDKSHNRPDGGSGLGLALCDLVAKAHGAQLMIESEQGEGTTVTVSFK